MPRLYPRLRGLLWLLIAWLSAHVIADIAHLMSEPPQPVHVIKRPFGTAPMPPVALAFWSESKQAPRQHLPLTQLPLTLQGMVQAPRLSQSLVVLSTPEGQITAMTGDLLMPQVTLEDITSQGLILNHQNQQERLPWPETMTQTEPTL